MFQQFHDAPGLQAHSELPILKRMHYSIKNSGPLLGFSSVQTASHHKWVKGIQALADLELNSADLVLVCCHENETL
jgi:hypothetical protein